MTHIVVARTEPCLTTSMKHFERTETHIDVIQRPRCEEALPSLSLAWLRCGYTCTNDAVTRRIVLLSTVCCLCDAEKLLDTSAVADDLLHFHTEVPAYFKALLPGKWIEREGPIT